MKNIIMRNVYCVLLPIVTIYRKCHINGIKFFSSSSSHSSYSLWFWNDKNDKLIESNTAIPNVWMDFEFPLDHQLLNHKHFQLPWNHFLKLVQPFLINHHLQVMFVLKMKDIGFKSITNMVTFTQYNIDDAQAFFLNAFELKGDYYSKHEADLGVLKFKLLHVGKDSKYPAPVFIKTSLDSYFDFHTKIKALPTSKNLDLWGQVTKLSQNLLAVVKDDVAFMVSNNFNMRHVAVHQNGDPKLTWKDFFHKNWIQRKLHDGEIYYNHNQEKLLSVKYPKTSDFIQKLNPTDKKVRLHYNVIAYDIETYTDKNNTMKPYCVSFFDGAFHETFYLNSYYDHYSLIRDSLQSLLKKKYHNSRVYIHNFSNFDFVFMGSVIIKEWPQSEILMKNHKIYQVKLTDGKYSVYLKDSFLMLPMSLAKLAKSFKATTSKTPFPYAFMNYDTIHYQGHTPDRKFWNLNDTDYQNMIAQRQGQVWNAQKETIEYCVNDVKVLHHVVTAFRKHIFDSENLDVNKYLTLPSLSFATYRNSHMTDYDIPVIKGPEYQFVAQAYTGGHVDVYKPYGTDLTYYDVNSLYPFAMKYFDVPVGVGTQFDGDITIKDPDAFGFFEVEVEAPDNIEKPILLVKTAKGTMAPKGKWIGVYFSEELKNASKYGYKYKVLRGFTYQRGKIFDSYIDKYYNIKKSFPKGTQEHEISKIFLNSLYGKFGMKPNKYDTVYFTSNEEQMDYMQKNPGAEIESMVRIGGKMLFSIKKEEEQDFLNINVAIAVAIVANARIHMSKYKMDPTIDLFYSDTDSLVVKGSLPEYEIGSELGQYKVEHKLKEGVFIAPKVYGGKADGYEFVKVKGLKSKINLDTLKQVLVEKTELKLVNEKWMRSVEKSNIKVVKQPYSLKITSNKRMVIYRDGIFVNTAPIKVNLLVKRKSKK